MIMKNVIVMNGTTCIYISFKVKNKSLFCNELKKSKWARSDLLSRDYENLKMSQHPENGLHLDLSAYVISLIKMSFIEKECPQMKS